MDLSHRQVHDKKMTTAQRNKQKRHAEQQVKLREAKAEKARLKQFNRTGEFVKELKKGEKQALLTCHGYADLS